jgi:hypothetical protein
LFEPDSAPEVVDEPLDSVAKVHDMEVDEQTNFNSAQSQMGE